MKRITLILIFLITLPSTAQQQITLKECYQLIVENYPLVKKNKLLQAQNKLDTDVISISKLPKFSLDAQATYQSDVIEFPIAMSGIEPLNKDQYRATLSVNQLIYNGGTVNAFLDLKSVELKAKQQQVNVGLHQLKQQINQLYFSILLTQESVLLLKAKQAQIQTKLKEVQSAIRHGVMLPSSDKILETELLKIHQHILELESNKETYIQTISLLIGKQLNTSTLFKNPIIEMPLDANLKRPELELFQLKKQEIESSKKIISKQNSPKLIGFATSGYGNPGLNMLDNSFQTFYTVGLKLNWNIFDWNATKKQQKSLSINKEIIDNETEIFKLNTSIELNKQQEEIRKINQFILSDLEIINLRKEVLKTTDSQLKNGVITSSAYITELTNLYEDKNMLIKHKIQLQLAKANYIIIKGQ